MSDDATTKNTASGELNLDFGDAIESWELDLDQVATAESSPLGPAAHGSDEESELSLEALEAVEEEPARAKPARRAPPVPPAHAMQRRAATSTQAGDAEQTSTAHADPLRSIAPAAPEPASGPLHSWRPPAATTSATMAGSSPPPAVQTSTEPPTSPGHASEPPTEPGLPNHPVVRPSEPPTDPGPSTEPPTTPGPSFRPGAQTVGDATARTAPPSAQSASDATASRTAPPSADDATAHGTAPQSGQSAGDATAGRTAPQSASEVPTSPGSSLYPASFTTSDVPTSPGPSQPPSAAQTLAPPANGAARSLRMSHPPRADELEQVARERRTLVPALTEPHPLLDVESGSTVIEPTPDELLEAILTDHHSPSSAPSPPISPETARAPAATSVDFARPTPVVGMAAIALSESTLLPTPVIEPADRVPRSDAPILEVLESSELSVDGELDIDPTDVSERPGWAEKRERLQRLEALIARSTGEAAADLLITAGELAEELGEPVRAEAFYQRAMESSPRHAPALRALARLSFRAGDMPRHIQMVERLSELAGPSSLRARALAELALLRWIVQRDGTSALRHATEATRLAPGVPGYALLLARIEAATYPGNLDATLAPLAERTQDKALAAMWWVAAGRACETRGEREAARALYARATAADPFAFDAQLSLSRMQHALGANGEAARSLLRTLESFDIGPVAEAVRRRAAPLLGSEGAHTEAVELLEHASDDVSLRTAMQIALASSDPALQAQAAESWVLGADGRERALALLTQAELLAEQGQFERAEGILELAALADPNQALVPVARESLARRAGNPARLAEVLADEEAGRGALAAAAQLASSQGNAAEEFTWLREAAENTSNGMLPDLLAIDAGAELARLGEVEELLRRVAARGDAGSRVRAQLALAEILVERGDAEAARSELARAVEFAPGNAAAERALARGESGERRAQAHQREAAALREDPRFRPAQSAARSAFLQLRAGFALEPGSSARLEAFAEAAEVAPDYAPAAWALHREARQQADLSRLSMLHAREAERATDARTRVTHLVRAALIRAGEDTDVAAEQLTRALALAPDDPILAELVIRLGDAAPGAVRAAALERLARHTSEPFRNALLLATAGVLEDESRLEDAGKHYREVLRTSPNDPMATAGLERVSAVRGGSAARLPALRRAVEEASTERERAQALEALLLCESEPARVLETAHALLALEPAHALGLRALERDAMTRDDRAALRAVEERLIHDSRGARDRAARLRLYQLLHVLEDSGEDANEDVDEKTLECAADAGQSLWLSRQLMSSAVARSRRDLVVRAVELLAERSNDAVELASLAVQRGWLTLGAGASSLEGALREALGGYPEHPTALELRAEVKRAVGELEEAAQLFEQAAGAARSNERAAHLWTRAAQLWDGQLAQPERAKSALIRAAERELDYPGVQERLVALLTEQRDLDGLVALTQARIDKCEGTAELSELRRKLAELHEQRGDREGARRCLREALAHDPDGLPIWRDLARSAARAELHIERAEALTAIVRLSRDPLELRDALLELADLYETHMPDLPRAEAAYQRVLKLGPRNPVALERLSLLYKRQGKHELAVDALAQLVRALPDGRPKHDSTLELAAWKREHGDRRGAEELLEGLRRSFPTDRVLLRRLSELLHEANDQGALALHLNRALSDLRHALASQLGDVSLWCALVDTLLEKGRRDAASQCAETALALGLKSPGLEDHIRSNPGELGIGAAALSELLDDLVYPEASPSNLRIVFRHAADALNRVAPLDLRVLGAERLDKRHALRNVASEQARWSGSREIEIYTTSLLPYAFVPIQDAPVQLLVGSALLESLTSDEQQFLVARALKLARAQMSIACRLRPAELELWLHGLVRNQVPSHTPTFIETSTLEEAARRIGKQLKRAAQHELAPHLMELTYVGSPRFDANSVYGVASIAASRAGLLAIGNVRPALSALLKLSGTENARELSAANVAQIEEARELVAFAISDAYAEARTRAGKEGR